jgi:hypothetical protein
MNNNPMNSKSSKQPSSANLVALLIDGQNIGSEQIDQILAEAEKLGEVIIRWIYGDWSDRKFYRRWNDALIQHALEPVHCRKITPSKNGSDIALVVGAMNVFCSNNIKRFCIVASDSDYMPLVLQLRREGCEVLGIGGRHTPKPLRDAYSKFVFIEQLSPPPQVTASSPMHNVALKNGSADELKLANLLKEAYLQASELRKGNEWVPIWQLGSELSKLDANYKALLGKKSLTTLVTEREDLFETRKQGREGHIEVKLRKHEAEDGSIAA